MSCRQLSFVLSKEESFSCITHNYVQKQKIQYDFVKARMRDEDKSAGKIPAYHVWIPKAEKLLAAKLLPGWSFRPSGQTNHDPRTFFGYAACSKHPSHKACFKLYCLLDDFFPGNEIKFHVEDRRCALCFPTTIQTVKSQ